MRLVDRVAYLNNVKRRKRRLLSGAGGLLAGQSWQAGINTTISEVGGRIRCARLGGTPRIYKQVTLIPGRTYRMVGNIYRATSNASINMRVSDTSGIGLDGPHTSTYVASPSSAVDTTFVADAAAQFFGFIAAIATTDGLYFEIDKDFAMYLVE